MSLRLKGHTLRLRHRDAGITLLNACADPALFGPWFKEQGTWRAWRVFLKALFGLHLTFGERVTFTKYTGRKVAPTRQAREAFLVIGRRGGKSFIVALIAVFLATFRDYRPFLAPGERATIMVLAADRKQSRTVMRYARALLEGVPMLARRIERMGSESIDLAGSVVLEVHTSSFRSVRGYSVAAAICDELAFWRDENSANPDVEILDALRPAMATIPHSLLLCLSSPYARRGALWDAYRDHYGKDDSDTLIWQADTRSMNPTVPQSFIDNAYADDPVAAAAEYGGQFRSDIEAFIAAELIDGAVRENIHEIAPQPGVSYTAHFDPAGGASGGDSFSAAIAHSEGGQVVLDVCRGRRGPFDPHVVTKDYAKLLKSYGLSSVTGDYYSAEWCTSAFAECGISYRKSERTKSDIYLEALPLFSTGAVQLLDNRQLLAELRGLERRTGRGKDIIDHPPRAHDDLANAAVGALLNAVRSVPVDFPDSAYVSSDAADRADQQADINAHLAEQGHAAVDVTDYEDGPFTAPWRQLP